MSIEKWTYRSRFLPIFLSIFSIGFIIFISLNIVDEWLITNLTDFLIFLTMHSVVSAGVSFVLILIFPVYVLNAGIRGYNFWGKYYFIEWSKIKSIKRFKLLWLNYFVIIGEVNDKIYVPSFLSNKINFLNRIKQITGDNHIFVRNYGDF